VRRHFSPGRLVVAGLALLAVAAAVLWLVPSNTYIFLPDDAHPVAPLVQVRGERRDQDGGGIYFVDVLLRKATLFERLFPGIRDGSSLVPAEAVNPPGVSDAERQHEDARLMTRSQEVAAAVALRELGYKVQVQRSGALVSQIAEGAPADGVLAPGDVIVSVDGRRASSPADLRRLIARHRPGESVRLGLRRDGKLRSETVATIADKDEPTRPVIGVLVDPAASIRLPFPVTIDAGNIGGPSAGLAFALDILEELGRDVDHGHRVAATGALAVDGSVEPVGGLKQKTIGAKGSGVDVFLVPAGENAREARRYAGNLRVVPVRSFRQALQILATLPAKP
jgi:PDZ domain-containing protein